MAMPAYEPIVTPRLILRRFRYSDLPTLLAYRNDPDIARYQAWSARSESTLQLVIAEMQNATPFTPDGFQYAIELRATQAHLGDVYVRLLEYDPRQAEIGYTLARAYHRKGYASEAVAGLLNYAFTRRSLHRVIATADTANIRSIAVLERVGMRREAHFVKSFENKGEWRDEYQYAVLRDEWLRNPITAEQFLGPGGL